MREARPAVRVFTVACGVAAACLVGAGTAGAQPVELTFDDGLVSITATDVPVRRVLDEWARLGQTLVVNAELLGDRRVSLRLDRMPQARAIARVLESAAGYVARRRAGPAGPSDFDLILVLATSEARPSGDAPAADAADLGLWDLVPPADSTADAAAEPEAGPARDARAEISENEANGREEAVRPSFGGMTAGLPEPPVPVEELPVGRPENARPGTPPPVEASPKETPAETPAVVRPAAAGPPVDPNGRPPRKP